MSPRYPMFMSINTDPLSPEEQDALRRLSAPRGPLHAGEQLGVSRTVVVSALAGLPLRRGSLALLHAGLAPYLTPAASAASAAA